jgi:KDO2-lipid IV(A) lauroyltransferase
MERWYPIIKPIWYLKLKNIFKSLFQNIEFIIFVILNKTLKLLSFNTTSNLGSFLVSIFGKFTKYPNIISKNLENLECEKSLISSISKKNLSQTGRVFFEFFNLNKFNWESISLENEKYLQEIKEHQGSKIFISAHIGNWEITRNYLLNLGFKLHSVYRHANNLKIDQYIQKNRSRENAYFYKKGSDSAKNMIKALKNNEDLALLVDQRDSSGPIINFLGKQAYATDGFANLALKYQTMICPVYSVRQQNGSFKFIYEKPLYFRDYKGLSANKLVEKVHTDYFEKWIRENPTQWLWVHQRWKL